MPAAQVPERSSRWHQIECPTPAESCGRTRKADHHRGCFELFPGQPNTVALLADRGNGSQHSANALLQASFRMRSDRIIVGEGRGAGTLTYLEAIITGHGGSVSTIHAETAKLAIGRLAIMVLQAGTPLTFAEVREYFRKSIDVIVQLGRAEGKRGVTEFSLPCE